MNLELIEDALRGLYCSLFATVCKLKENKKRDHQRYDEEFDERHDRLIQDYTALAERVYDMLEDLER